MVSSACSGVVVGVRRGGHVIADLEHRQLRELAHRDPPLAQLRRLRCRHSGRRRIRGDGLEVLLRQRHDLVEGDIAGDDQGGVRRGIPHLEVVLQIVERPGLDVRHPAHDRPLIGVGGVGGGPELLVEHARVVRVHAVAALRRDDAAFGLDDLGIERQVLNPIGLEIEDALEGRTREPVLVHGDVLARVGVVGAAAGLHDAVELARPVLLRAVEHHVLEEVGDPRDAGPLVARARRGRRGRAPRSGWSGPPGPGASSRSSACAS